MRSDRNRSELFVTRRPVLTTFLLLAAALIAFAIFVDRLADLREAGIEARFPPEGEIVQVNGRDIHVVVRGKGPDLVLIHGAGANARDFTSTIVDQLAETYRVFAVDRPGHGWSDRLGPEFEGAFNTRGETPIEQAKALSEAVRQLGARDPIVLGFSYGGAVAMAWGLESPASAIVVIAGVTLPWPGKVDITYRVLGSALGGALLAPLGSIFVPDGYIQTAVTGAFRPQDAPPGYVTQTGVPLATRIKTLRANNRQVHRLKPTIEAQSERYDAISIPIEIVHGTEDKTVYAEIHAIPLAERLPSANVTILDGIGHMPHHVAANDVIAAIDQAAARAGLR